MSDKLCIVLGCGLKNISRSGHQVLHVDVRSEVNPDQLVDLSQFPWPWPNEFADWVVAEDVIEHFSWRLTKDILRQIHRILKPKGKLTLQCPNAYYICKEYIEGTLGKGHEGTFKTKCEALSFWLGGAQDYPENTHKAFFDVEGLTYILGECGFQIERLESDGGSNLVCEAYKK